MDISTEMIDAATAKAVEAGLFPRRALKEELDEARMIMFDILQAALSAPQAETAPLSITPVRPASQTTRRLTLVYARS